MRSLKAWRAAAAAIGCLYFGAATPADLPEVLVTGEQPGPGIWKVSNGEHRLWVLGTIAVLPKHMKWKADGIEKILGSSQAILSYPGIEPDADIGAFAVIGLLPSLIGIEKLPDGGTLQQVLSPPIYARWVEQRQKVIGDSRRFERLRPFIAIGKLAEAARDQAGLGDAAELIASVRKLARKYRLKRVDAEYHLFIRDPKSAIKSFKKMSLDEDVCFSYQLDELRHSLAESTLTANAWARGDVAALTAGVARGREDPCWQGFGDIGFVKDLGIGSIADRVNDAWLKVAEQTLKDNRQSFAFLDMSDVLSPEGLLALLAARGYPVQGPLADP